MVDTHLKSYQNQFLHLDTEKILSAPLYILLGSKVREKQEKKKAEIMCLNSKHCA